MPACSSCSTWQTSSRCPPATSWPCCTPPTPTCPPALFQVSAAPCYSSRVTLTVTVWTLLTCGGASSVTDHLLCHSCSRRMWLTMQAASCWWLVGVQSLWQSSHRAVHTPPANMYTSLSTTSNTASRDSTEKHVEHRLSVDARLLPCVLGDCQHYICK